MFNEYNFFDYLFRLNLVLDQQSQANCPKMKARKSMLALAEVSKIFSEMRRNLSENQNDKPQQVDSAKIALFLGCVFLKRNKDRVHFEMEKSIHACLSVSAKLQKDLLEFQSFKLHDGVLFLNRVPANKVTSLLDDIETMIKNLEVSAKTFSTPRKSRAFSEKIEIMSVISFSQRLLERYSELVNGRKIEHFDLISFSHLGLPKRISPFSLALLFFAIGGREYSLNHLRDVTQDIKKDALKKHSKK